MSRMSELHADHRAAHLAHYERERRTAACIKACEGIPTETLEGGFEAINAELLEALKALLDDTWDGYSPTEEMFDAARAAISKAEGSDE